MSNFVRYEISSKESYGECKEKLDILCGWYNIIFSLGLHEFESYRWLEIQEEYPIMFNHLALFF